MPTRINYDKINTMTTVMKNSSMVSKIENEINSLTLEEFDYCSSANLLISSLSTNLIIKVSDFNYIINKLLDMGYSTAGDDHNFKTPFNNILESENINPEIVDKIIEKVDSGFDVNTPYLRSLCTNEIFVEKYRHNNEKEYTELNNFDMFVYIFQKLQKHKLINENENENELNSASNWFLKSMHSDKKIFKFLIENGSDPFSSVAKNTIFYNVQSASNRIQLSQLLSTYSVPYMLGYLNIAIDETKDIDKNVLTSVLSKFATETYTYMHHYSGTENPTEIEKNIIKTIIKMIKKGGDLFYKNNYGDGPITYIFDKKCIYPDNFIKDLYLEITNTDIEYQKHILIKTLKMVIEYKKGIDQDINLSLE